jgi:pimeloyl-ACP methyl ester carboxylesterase
LSELEKDKSVIPKLYIMGGEDHLFLAPVKKIVANDSYSQLQIVPNCGHVVNIDNHLLFNELSIDFIEKQSID